MFIISWRSSKSSVTVFFCAWSDAVGPSPMRCFRHFTPTSFLFARDKNFVYMLVVMTTPRLLHKVLYDINHSLQNPVCLLLLSFSVMMSAGHPWWYGSWCCVRLALENFRQESHISVHNTSTYMIVTDLVQYLTKICVVHFKELTHFIDTANHNERYCAQSSFVVVQPAMYSLFKMYHNHQHTVTPTLKHY